MTPTLYRLTRYLPYQLRAPFQHKLAASMFRDYLIERIGYFYVHVDDGPMPPDHLIMRTSVLSEGHIKTVLNRNTYFSSGYLQILRWLKALEKCGFNIRTTATIMELGCGSGRLLRHLRCVDGIRLIGTDVQPALIEWCTQNLPGIDFYVNQFAPPIYQIKNESIDLIYASSVFTHIPLATQVDWLAEMKRIMKPGGFLLISLLGRKYMETMLTPEQQETVRNTGHFELSATDENISVSSRLNDQWDVFQSRSEVIDTFRKYFKIRDYLPSHQDLIILQKPVTTVSKRPPQWINAPPRHIPSSHTGVATCLVRA